MSDVLPASDGAKALDTSARTREGNVSRTWAAIRRDKVTIAALLWLMLVAAVALVGSFWTPYPPNEQFVADPFRSVGGSTVMGTDDLGRDVFSRMMVGASVSLRVSLVVVGSALLLALPLGLFAGYRGGYVDTAIMRVIDTITSIPGIVSALAIVGVLGPGLNNVMIALTIIMVPLFVRLTRAQALSVTAEPHIAASRSVGSSTPWIMVFRVLPGVIPALAVQVSLALGGALTAEAALNFLGLGVLSPNASWGGVLQRAYQNMLAHPGGVVPPVLAIGSVVLAFNLVGDGLRDALGTGVHRGARRRARLGLTSVRRSDSARSVAIDQAPPAADTPRLRVTDLCVEFETPHARLRALDHVSFDVRRGEILGIVGESGSGKTVTAMTIMRLLQSPPAVVTAGAVAYEGRDLLELPMDEMRKIRSSEISIIFQNPMTSIDPVYTIGNSLREAIRNHEKLSRAAANARAVELLELVGIPSAASRLNEYPHNFSGGMRQRVMIAMALAGRPKLLIADEPTTALDVTIQAQILDLIVDLRKELDMSVILVTHDLGVVAEVCDRVAVMYAGHIVELAPVHDVFASPVHPYTAGLLAAVPLTESSGQRLASLPGRVPALSALPDGCRFAPRCAYAIDACSTGVPQVESLRGRQVRCFRAAELELAGR